MIPSPFGRVLNQLGRSKSEPQLCYLLVWVLVQHHHWGWSSLAPHLKGGDSNRTHFLEGLLNRE